MLKHFVVTRLGLGIYHMPWYESALALFDAITVPSLRAQTSRDFTWLIVADQQIPDQALNRLRVIVGDAQNFHIVPLDLTNMHWARHGGFDAIWNRCHDYIAERNLVADPTEYVITSAIDADDAWNRETVATVRQYLEPELPRLLADEVGRSMIVRHTSGQVLTLPRGIRWFAQADVARPLDYEFLGMSIFVMARLSSGITVSSSRHSAWPLTAQALMFGVTKAEPDRPMWVYVRHDRSQVDWQVDSAESDPEATRALHADFGIDFTKVDAWRANTALRRQGAQSDLHAGLSGREQLDCYFRITAYNRHIAALERKQRLYGLNKEDELLLLERRQTRLELVLRLRRQGDELFR